MSMLIVPRFDPNEILQLIETYRPTLFPGVPTMYVALSQVAKGKGEALSSLRACNSGGAPMPVQVMEGFEAMTGAVVLEGFGLSETSPVTHANRSKQQRKLGSVGLPVEGTEACVIDLVTGEQLGVGQPGELLVRGPQVMKGYWGRDEESRRALTEDGWLHTGDIATIDEEGYTYIVDRKKDMILASGYNVYPREVEEVLYRHPAVLEAAVVGVPDSYRGETVKAFVALRRGQSLDEGALVAWCREHLAAYKVPHLVEFREALPKTAVGKVLRRALAEEARQG